MIALLLAGVCQTALASTLTVQVRDAQGKVVRDAVVTVKPESSAARAPSISPPPATHIIDQRNEAFIPYVQLLRPGDQVVFSNNDGTRHQVYSFSRIKQFEFTLRPGERSAAITIDKAGIAAVGCNIHDRMVTYLFVSADPHVAMSNDRGNATVDNLPPGQYSVSVWHPQLQPGTPMPTKPLNVGTAPMPVSVDFSLSLIPDPRDRLGGDHDVQ